MTPRRIETWKSHGNVEVVRDTKGRFISWQKLASVIGFRGKTASFFGEGVVNGIRARRRWEIRGSGVQIRQAFRIAYHLPPKDQFVTVSARELLRNPHKYTDEGYWIYVDVESG